MTLIRHPEYPRFTAQEAADLAAAMLPKFSRSIMEMMPKTVPAQMEVRTDSYTFIFTVDKVMLNLVLVQGNGKEWDIQTDGGSPVNLWTQPEKARLSAFVCPTKGTCRVFPSYVIFWYGEDGKPVPVTRGMNLGYTPGLEGRMSFPKSIDETGNNFATREAAEKAALEFEKYFNSFNPTNP